jgi:hypothetical protein
MTNLPNSFLNKGTFTLLVLSFIAFVGISPILSQEVIAIGGQYLSNSSGSISYTIGETVIETLTGSNNILTQGFQQTNLIVTAINEAKRLNFEISAYPNPTQDFIRLRIGKENIKGMQYLLYDLNGKLIDKHKLLNQETDISFEHLAPASYILKILDKKTELKSFQIINTN